MNERVAAETNGRVLLRIEDLDRTRCKPQFEAAIIDDLAWLGLRFPTSPRRQSEHANDYAAALARLDQQGLVYPCFCSRAEIARASNGQRDADGAPLYPGTCRALSPAEARDRLARGERATFRLDMRCAADAGAARLCWTEFGEGAIPAQQPAAPEVWGDVVLRGRDLAASYHLAVVVDDALQGVTDVVRGRDLLAATAVHRLLQALLGLAEPRYRHHRLVLDQTERNYRKAVNPGRLPNCARQAWRRKEFAPRWGSLRAPASDLRLSSVEAPRLRAMMRTRASPPTSPRRREPRP